MSNSTSTSSTSGIIATVAVEVWIRPPDSVAGIRCTRCTPLSYFNFEYAPVPLIIKTISLNPPMPFSFEFIVSTFQWFDSANLQYIRYKSAANNAASSPPAPARISTITFLSSFGSFGRSKMRSSFSMSSIFPLHSLSSSFASSLISSSVSSSSIAKLSSIPAFVSLYSRYFSTIGSKSDCSFISF